MIGIPSMCLFTNLTRDHLDYHHTDGELFCRRSACSSTARCIRHPRCCAGMRTIRTRRNLHGRLAGPRGNSHLRNWQGRLARAELPAHAFGRDQSSSRLQPDRFASARVSPRSEHPYLLAAFTAAARAAFAFSQLTRGPFPCSGPFRPLPSPSMAANPSRYRRLRAPRTRLAQSLTRCALGAATDDRCHCRAP